MADKDIIVTNEGTSAGALVAGIVAVLLILLAVWYFGFRPAGEGEDININVDVPETVAPSD
ncbi:MAG TPA: hypothetical protein VJR05_04670 [Acidimicrobiia bacterium]|nr:hypothetical protein [Acidimicrobiia bacterium]